MGRGSVGLWGSGGVGGFFFLFFIVLWNHWQPRSGALEDPAIAAMIDYTFRLKELHPALRMPCEDWRSKLESLSVQMFAYALTMVSNQLCWSTSIPHWTWIQIKYVLNQYKTGAIAEPVCQGASKTRSVCDVWVPVE